MKYWSGRYLDVKKAQLSKAKKYENDYLKRMAETQEEIDKEITKWVKKYAEEDGLIDPIEAKRMLRGKDLSKWNYTLEQWETMAKDGGYEKEMNLEYYKSRVHRLKELEGQISKLMAEPTRNEIQAFEKLLKETHDDAYLKTIFTRQMQTGNINSQFNRLSENQTLTLIRNGWKGSNFSERLWQNSTKQLPKILTESLFKGITLGYNQDELVQAAKRKLKGFNDNDIHRLVITESAYITEQATFKAYEESGVEKFEWIAALEIHTCEMAIEIGGKTYKGCRGLDGAVFEMGAKILLPPAHPFCRCTTAPWDEILEELRFNRWARDPVTGKSVDTEATTFNEWSEMIGLNKKAEKPSEKGQTVKPAKALADKIKNDQELKDRKTANNDNRARYQTVFEEYKKSRTSERYEELRNMREEIRIFEEEYVEKNADRIKELFSEYRQMGVQDLDLKGHITNPRAELSKLLTKAYDYYPTDWIKRSMAYGTITTKKVKRGYYQHGLKAELAISANSGLHNSLRTAIHELGHRQEHIYDAILEAEKAFYEHRTKGEDLVLLSKATGNSAYKKYEVTRVDNFLDPYMGKSYPGDRAFELLTMGTDTLFADPMELAKDPEMFDWVVEMLLTK